MKGTTGPSALLSSLIQVADGGDLFNINLQEAVTPNFSGKYIFDPDEDRVPITAIGEQGTVGKQFRIKKRAAPG